MTGAVPTFWARNEAPYALVRMLPDAFRASANALSAPAAGAVARALLPLLFLPLERVIVRLSLSGARRSLSIACSKFFQAARSALHSNATRDCLLFRLHDDEQKGAQ